jgi:outer membrane protein assembly factor BamE
MLKSLIRLPLTLLVAALIASCGIVYHVPVYQGNLLEKKNVEQLQKGMTKGQVLQLLGTPSIADPFHTQRWDYVATERYSRMSTKTEIKTLTLMFEGDKLTGWEGEYFPEQDVELSKKMKKFGNLPRDKKKKSGESGDDSGGSGY